MFKKQHKILWLMGGLTLIGFPLLAWPLLWFQDIAWSVLFAIDTGKLASLLVLLSLGLFYGLVMIFLSEMPYFEKSLSRIKDRLANIQLNTFFVFFISIAAGFGEEIFFRGALQPIIGLLLTSFLFVLIHGYFSYKNLRINILGFLLFGFILFIGWVAETYSLWHAIAAHFSYDLVLLFYYKRMQQNSF